MAKKNTNTKTAENDATTEVEAPATPIRWPGDGRGMLSADEVHAIHGKDVVEANERKAREIRARKGE